MKTLAWILAGVSITVFVLVLVDGTKHLQPANDDVDDAADKAGAWGAKQRAQGTGGNLLGQVKEGFGKLTGDNEMQGKGLVDQAVGSVKDAAGQVAGAVGDGLHKANAQTY